MNITTYGALLLLPHGPHTLRLCVPTHSTQRFYDVLLAKCDEALEGSLEIRRMSLFNAIKRGRINSEMTLRSSLACELFHQDIEGIEHSLHGAADDRALFIQQHQHFQYVDLRYKIRIG